MANAREIQSRMKSIQDTMKITNAMYMISSTKLRKAKKSLEETEPYFNALRNILREHTTIMSLKRRWKRLSSVRTTSSSWLAS